MPREVKTINSFGGIIGIVDQEDVPDNAAVYSLNVDPDSEHGVLRGVPIKGAAYTADSTQIPDTRVSGFINWRNATAKTEAWDLVYHDSADEHISVVRDFYNGTEASRKLFDLVTANVLDESCITINNKQAHIGTGNGSVNVPQWVGRVEYGQFGHGTQWSVDDCTDDTVSPIVITTTATHNLATGDIVIIDGVEGNTAADGTWQVTYVDALNFNLDGSTGVGNYTTGGTVTRDLVVAKRSADTTPLVSTDYVPTAELSNYYGTDPGQFSVENLGISGTAAIFLEGVQYRYGLSLQYDGLQESPLKLAVQTKTTLLANASAITMDIRADTALTVPTVFNKRISAVKIYRAEKPSYATEYGKYTLVQAIDVNDAGWASDTPDKLYSLTDNGYIGATYEAETGIPETLDSTLINHSLSADGDGYHFIGKCWQADLSGLDYTKIGVKRANDASNFIFRSQSFRYDMFDWSTNFVVLPEIPVAMQYYQGRLYAFTPNKMYRIHPDMYIEDVLEGVGCSGHDSVCVTEYGMFFANNNGAYWYNGKDVKTISETIRDTAYVGSGADWSTVVNTEMGRHIVVPMFKTSGTAAATIRKFICFIGDITAASRCWAYHIPTGRWDFWNFGTISLTVNSGVVKGKDGELYLSDATDLREVLGGATKESTTWVSKEDGMGESGQDKKFYKVIFDSKTPTGAVVCKYASEGSNPASGTATTSGAYITSANQKKKTLQLYFTTTLNAEIDSYEIVFRRLIGKR